MNIFADIIKILTRFIKKSSKTQEKLKQSISVFLDITKFADFWWENANVNRTQGVCNMIDVLFRSSLGKV